MKQGWLLLWVLLFFVSLVSYVMASESESESASQKMYNKFKKPNHVEKWQKRITGPTSIDTILPPPSSETRKRRTASARSKEKVTSENRKMKIELDMMRREIERLQAIISENENKPKSS